MIKFGSITLFLSGLNIERFINKLTDEKVSLLNLKRVTKSSVECKIKNKDYNKFLLLAGQNKIEVESSKPNGLLSFSYALKKHIGILVGVFLCVVFSLFLFSKVWDIKVLCNENINKEEVVSLLKSEGVEKGKNLNDISSEQVEKFLLLNYSDSSLISVHKRGVSLIVNIKKKNQPSVKVEGFSSIIASQGGVVESVNLIQGTLKVEVGDVVKKGDVLVEAFILNGEEKLEVEPKAEITIRFWCDGVVEFEENAKVLKKSGKVECLRYIELFGKKIGGKNFQTKFEVYEIDKSSKNICKNMLIPFKLIIERYNELTLQTETRKFEEVYETLLKKSSELANAKLDGNAQIVSEKSSYVKSGDKYIVRTVIEGIMSIK